MTAYVHRQADDPFNLMQVAGQLHEAGSGDGSWPDALNSVMSNLGAATASLYTTGSARFVERLATPGFSADAIRLYAEHYHQHDLWAAHGRQRVSRAPRLKAVLGQEFHSPTEFANTTMWNDFLRHHGGGFHLIGAAFQIERGTFGLLGIHRPRDHHAFDIAEQSRLDHLLQHMRMALRLRARLFGAELRQNAGLAALEALRAPAFVTDGHARLIFANSAASALVVDPESPLRLRRPESGDFASVLVAVHRGDSVRLAALIAGTAGGGAGGGVRLRRSDGGPSQIVLVSPLPTMLSPAAGQGAPGIQAGHALVSLRDPGAPVNLSPALLGRLFGLSRAESEVAVALSGGATAESIAARRRVGVATVRTQIREILGKTETTNLRALERLMGSL